MHVLALVLPLLAIADAAHNSPYIRHRRMDLQHQRHQPKDIAQPAPRANSAHADAHKVIKRVVQKRGQQCRVRPTSSSSAAPSATSSDAPTSSIDSQNAYAHGDNQKNKDKPSSSSWTPPAASSAPANNNNGNNGGNGGGLGGIVGGLLNFNDNKCGWCGSSDKTPNGSEDWLNCGLQSGGWSPPHVGMNDLIAKELSASGTFAPCAQYIDKFNQYAGQYGVHPIMLASFAMQESGCNAWATGGNGEAGLMQITPANCATSGGDCYNVDYNIRRGAELFSNMINQNGGNVLAAIGSYNGWRVGMTENDARKAKWEGNCFQQNNLDYIHQFVNGWMQGIDGHSLGTYFNLNGC